jgi:tetratricopeptide (TPR) repeat protein
MRIVRLFLPVTLWLCLAVSGARAFDNAPAVHEAMLRATDRLLNRDGDLAEAECQRLLLLPHGEAPGRFCLALVTLTRADDMDDPVPALDRFLAQATEAIAIAESLERSRPADAEVKLLLGLAQGTKALVDGTRKNYVAAFQALREAQRRFQEALQLDPNLIDAHYGIGLYEYALGHLPGLLKPLVSIVLPPGDPAHGVEELTRVAEQGTYLKMTARVALLELFVGQERRYAEALQLGRELLQRYPGNPDLYFATAYAASELGRFPEALGIARRVAQNMAESRPQFGPELAARYNQLMGKVYMDQGEYAPALAFFQRAVQAPTPLRYRWVIAWAWTRSGMIHDLQGEREEAVRRYRRALAVAKDGPARDQAQRYLETPYRGENRPAS